MIVTYFRDVEHQQTNDLLELIMYISRVIIVNIVLDVLISFEPK